MRLYDDLKKHWITITVFRAYSFSVFLSELIRFPIDYYFRDGKSSYPLNIAFFLTLRCNAMCGMCNLKELLNQGNKSEPTLDQIEEFVRKVAPKKPSFVLFGGEPLIRKDFMDILRIFKKYNLSCGMFTNGQLLNEERIKELVDLEIDYVAFSLQGPKEIHDRVVGINGAYDKLVKNLKKLCEMRGRTNVVIHTTISEFNIEHLDHVVELGRRFNVDLVRFGHPTFFTEEDIRKNNEFCLQNFPDAEIDEISYHYDPTDKGDIFVKNILEIKKKYKRQCTFTPNLSEDEIKDWYSNNFRSSRKCYFVWRALFIYPNGDVVPCESFKYIMGNIFESDFDDIWNGPRYVDFRRKLKKGLFPACARCCKL